LLDLEGHIDAERLGCFKVDHEFEFRRLQDWQLAGLLTFQDPACVDPELAILIGEADAIADQTAGFGELTLT
jgi:hypothetical protein